MKHWRETLEIAGRISAATPGKQLAIATVVHIVGSAYRRPGAKLLIEPQGAVWGGVSGGCLEADIREVALDVTRTRRVSLRHYRTGADHDSVGALGLGCEGEVDVFVQALEPDQIDSWRAMAPLLDGEAPFAVTTVLDGQAAGRMVITAGGRRAAGGTGSSALDGELVRRAGRSISQRSSTIDAVERTRVFTDVLVPPPWLTIFGAGDDAMPLARLAVEMGFRVAVVDHRAAFATAERFPGAHRRLVRRAGDGTAGIALVRDAAAVVMTHSFDHDTAWVRALLDTPVAYIGVLGPRERMQRVLESAAARSDARMFGPVGLDIGAEGPEQIALSVLAEVLAVRADRTGEHLRERDAAIHT